MLLLTAACLHSLLSDLVFTGGSCHGKGGVTKLVHWYEHSILYVAIYLVLYTARTI